jgi:hypothetical protein
MAPATLVCHPVGVRVAYGHHEVVEGPEIEGIAISNFRPSTRQKRGTTVPATRKHASIASKVRNTAQ